jgi:hypothetical protein
MNLASVKRLQSPFAFCLLFVPSAEQASAHARPGKVTPPGAARGAHRTAIDGEVMRPIGSEKNPPVIRARTLRSTAVPGG